MTITIGLLSVIRAPRSIPVLAQTGPMIEVEDSEHVVVRYNDHGLPKTVYVIVKRNDDYFTPSVTVRLSGFQDGETTLYVLGGMNNQAAPVLRFDELKASAYHYKTYPVTIEGGEGTRALNVDPMAEPGSDSYWESDIYWLWAEGVPSPDPGNPHIPAAIPLVIERQHQRELAPGYQLTVHYCTNFFRNVFEPLKKMCNEDPVEWASLEDMADGFALQVGQATEDAYDVQVGSWGFRSPSERDDHLDLVLHDGRLENPLHIFYADFDVETNNLKRYSFGFTTKFYDQEGQQGIDYMVSRRCSQENKSYTSVVLSHEYFHAVQSVYNNLFEAWRRQQIEDDGEKTGSWLSLIEGQATFIQSVQYEDVEFLANSNYLGIANLYLESDLEQYVVGDHEGAGVIWDHHGYHYALFWRALYEHNGGGVEGLTAIKNILNASGAYSGLPDGSLSDKELEGMQALLNSVGGFDEILSHFAARNYALRLHPDHVDGEYRYQHADSYTDPATTEMICDGKVLAVDGAIIPASFGIDLWDIDLNNDPVCRAAELNFWSVGSFGVQVWPVHNDSDDENAAKQPRPLLMDTGQRVRSLLNADTEANHLGIIRHYIDLTLDDVFHHPGQGIGIKNGTCSPKLG